MLNTLSLLLVAAPVLAFAWAYGGCRASVLAQVMPGASVLCAIGIFLLPQRRPDETWRMAVCRSTQGVLTDPFFWTALAFLVYLTIPLFNVALCPGCDWQAIDAGADPHPPCRFLPFCVNAGEHAGVLWLFGPALLSALGVRQGLTRTGRRMFLELLVWNAAVLSVLGFVQYTAGAKFPYWGTAEGATHFFSVFGYPNMGGAFFMMTYAFSLGVWCSRMGFVESLDLDLANAPRHLFLRAHYPFVAVALTLAGVLMTFCRAAILLVVVLTVIFIFYVILRAFVGNDWRRTRRFHHAVVAVMLLFSFLGVVYVYAPAEVGREVGTLDMVAVADRVSGKAQYHTRVATAMMRDFPFYGVGGWGYRHFQQCYMTGNDLRRQQIVGGANVHNDYLQFLAEHGLVGFTLLVACVWLLALPTGREWKRLAAAALAADRSRMGASASAIFAVSASVFWIFLGCCAVLAHAFGDCPFRAGAVLAVFLAALPASSGFLPRGE